MISSRTSRLFLGLLGFAVFAAPTGAAAAVSTTSAGKRAVSALHVKSGDQPVIVFRPGSALAGGTVISQAGSAAAPKGRSSKLGVVTSRATPIFRVAKGHRAYLFYADQAPYQAYAHRGRLALVDVATGAVRVSKTLSSPPVIDGRLPFYMRSSGAYNDPKNHVFSTPYKITTASAARATVAQRNLFTYRIDRAPLKDLAIAKAAADQLAADHACSLRVSDTYGEFYDFTGADQTRARLGDLFFQLNQLNPGFIDQRYSRTSGLTPLQALDALVTKKGCKDVFLYVAGRGYSTGPGTTIGIGTRVDRATVRQQLFKAADLDAYIAGHANVNFSVSLDAPYSKGILDLIAKHPNVLVGTTGAGATGASFGFLPEVFVNGDRIANTGNPDGLLEFTNRVLSGLNHFLSSSNEVRSAITARRTGAAPSFLAVLLGRAYTLGADDDLPAVAGIQKPFFVPTTLNPKGPPPAPTPAATTATTPTPAPQPPVASDSAVSTPEDTPLVIALGGSAPGGATATYAITTAPQHGTLTGTGQDQTYTPAADFFGTDTFTFSITSGSLSASAKVTITVTPVNDSAVVKTSAGSPTFTEGGGEISTDPAVTVTDVDDATLTGARVAITAGRSPDDLLHFTDAGGITGTYAAGTGVLTLSGIATASQYQDALRSITFEITGANPLAGTRTLSFQVDDGHGLGAVATRAITVVTIDDAPILSGAPSTLAYTENAAATAVGPGITISDPDSPTMGSATVKITGGYVSTEDRLSFTAAGGITGTFDVATGTLTLSGEAPVADYSTALANVQYANLGDNPTTAARTLSFQVDDGQIGSNTVTSSVTVARVNDAPVVATTTTGQPTFTEKGTAVVVDAGLTVTDVDNTSLSGATVSIGSGFAASQDALTFTAIGAITGNYNGLTGVLSLTGAGTLAQYQTVLRSVSFSNPSSDPSTADRVISFTATDGSATSTAATRTVTVVPVNDAPTVSTSAGTATYTEGGTATTVDSGIAVADVDSTDLTGATVTITDNLVAGDQLGFGTQNGITGTYDAPNGVLTLTGTATVASYATALASVTYSTTSENPTNAARTISFAVTDAALTSAPATRVVNVTPVNDAPVVATSTDPASTFTEAQAGAVIVDGAITVTDPDDTSLQGATIGIASADFQTGDVLGVNGTLPGAVTKSYNVATGVLTISGTATVAQYQTILDAVTYSNARTDLPNGTRSVTFAATDGTTPSTAVSKTVNFAAVNTAPTLTAGALPSSWTEGSAPTPIDTAIVATDVDDVNLEGATATITAAPAAGDVLSFTAGSGITGAYNAATFTLTLTGTATVAQYQAALRTVAYSSTDDDVSSAARTVSYTVTDGDLTSAPSTHTIAVVPTDDAPTVTASADAANAFTEGASTGAIVDGSIAVTDPDDTTLAGATVSITTGFQSQDVLAVGTLLGGATQSYNAGTGVLTITGSATVAQYEAMFRDVRFSTPRTDLADGSRTVSFVADDGTLTSAAATHTVSFTSVNSPPTVTTSGGSAAYTEGGAGVAVDPGLTVADADSANLSGARVRVTAPVTGDTLGFTDGNGISGSLNAGGDVLTLTGTATKANYQAALRTVTFSNTTNRGLTNASRTVDFQVTDQPGATSNVPTRQVTVTAVNDAPSVVLSSSVPAFTEGDSAIVVDGGVTVSDPDSTNLSAVEVKLVGSVVAGDMISIDSSFPLPSGIAVNGASTPTDLMLTGTASVASYQATLQHFTYFTASNNPTGVSRTARFTATDTGSLTSAPVDKTIAVTDVNSPPLAVADLFTTDEKTVKTGNVVTNDSDPDDASSTLVVDQVNGSSTNVGTQLTTAAGALVTVSSAGAISYDPNGKFDALQVGDPNGTDSITYRIEDPAGSTSNTVTVTFAITPVNDAPTGVVRTYNAARMATLEVDTAGDAGVDAPKARLDGTLLTGAADADDATPITTVAETVTTDTGGTAVIAADGTFDYVSKAGDRTSTTDRFSYQVRDTHNARRSVDVNIKLTGSVTWFVDSTPPAGTADGTSLHPYTTLSAAVAAASTNDQLYVSAGTTPGGATLRAGQDVQGAATALTATFPGTDAPTGTTTLAAAGTAPTLTSSAADVITVAAGGSVIRGVNVNPDGTVDGIHAGSAGPLALTDVAVSDTGTATTGDGIDISATTDPSGNGATLTNVDVTTNGAGAALRLANSKVVANTASDLTAVGGPALVSTGAINASGTLALGNVSASSSPTTAVTSSGGGDVSLQKLTVTNGTTGVYVDGAGAFQASSSTNAITGTSGTAFQAAAGSGSVSLGGQITTGATAVDVNHRTANGVAIAANITARNVVASANTGGVLTFSGNQTLTAGATNGVDLTNNTGATTNFTGGNLAITTTSGTGFNAAGGGTVGVDTGAGSGNTVSTTAGKAVNIANTTIGAGNVTFRSVSAASSSQYGVALDATGALGRFEVTGDAGTTRNTSGGTLTGVVGADVNNDSPYAGLAPAGSGLFLRSTNNPRFEQMTITGSQNFGILASGVSGLSFTHGAITSNGNNDAAGFSEGNVRLINVSGTTTFTDDAIQHPRHDNIHMTQDSGTATLGVVGNDILMDPTDTGTQGDSILIDGGGSTSSVTANITNNGASGSTGFSGAAGDHIQIAPSNGGTGTWTANITGNTLVSGEGGTGEDLGGGISLTPANWGGTFNYDITNNTLRGANQGYAINDDQGSGNSTMSGYIRGNTVGLAGDPNSGSAQGGDINVDALGAQTHKVLIQGNVLHGNSEDGIRVSSGGDAQNPKLSATITGNTVDSPSPSGSSFPSLHGIEANIGTDTGQTSTNCVDIKNNSVAGSGITPDGGFDIRVRQRQATTVQIPGYTGAANGSTLNAFLLAQNPTGTPTISSTAQMTGGVGGFTNTTPPGSACPQPTN